MPAITKPATRIAALLLGLSVASPALAGEDQAAPLSAVRALEHQQLVHSHAQTLRAQRPLWAEQVDKAPVSRSRTGSMVFFVPDIATPQAATLLVDRASSHPDAAFRRAVAEALPATKTPDLGSLVASQLPVETDPQVRVALAHALRYGQDAPTADALRLAARDENAQVRRSALRSMRHHPQAALFAAQVVAATQDEDASVQELALKAWGTLRDASLEVEIEPFLRSEHATLRLAALRAQSRVDLAQAQALIQRLNLVGDQDPKVARLAQRVLARR